MLADLFIKKLFGTDIFFKCPKIKLLNMPRFSDSSKKKKNPEGGY